MGDDIKDPLIEIAAMQKVAEALKDLEPAAAARVVHWAANHWGASTIASATAPPPPAASGGGFIPSTAQVFPPQGVVSEAPPVVAAQARYTDLGELFADANPQTDADKVLVVSYWLQFVEGSDDLSGYEVNKALKNLGYGVSNVTKGFDSLKARKPAPVIQLKKSGTSKQARKTYRITLVGKQAVEAMLPRQQ